MSSSSTMGIDLFSSIDQLHMPPGCHRHRLIHTPLKIQQVSQSKPVVSIANNCQLSFKGLISSEVHLSHTRLSTLRATGQMPPDSKSLLHPQFLVFDSTANSFTSPSRLMEVSLGSWEAAVTQFRRSKLNFLLSRNGK